MSEHIGKSRPGTDFGAAAQKGGGISESIRKPKGVWTATCYDKEGNLKWEDSFENMIVDQGCNYLLDVALSGATPITTWYVGLKNAGAPVAGDTLATPLNWTENANYTGTRKTWVEGGAAAKSISNTGNAAVFPIDTDTQTIAGAFLFSAASGTAGTLYAVGDFATSKSLDNGDTLNVVATFTMADDAL